jgi:alpha-L-fucosidase 2
LADADIEHLFESRKNVAKQMRLPPQLTRREFILSAGLALAFPGLAGAKAAAMSSGEREDLELFYEQAAEKWVEALPVGNGRLGAMVFGRVGQERLQLNEDTLFSGGPYSPNNPAMAGALPQVRALIAQERYQEAARLFDTGMLATPPRQMSYGACGDVLIDFANAGAPREYRRSLDLDSGVVTTRFHDGVTAHVREVFASVPDQLVVMHLRADGAPLSFKLSYRHPGPAVYDKASHSGPVTHADLVGAAWNLREDKHSDAHPSAPMVRPDGDAALLIEGRNVGSEGIQGALRYAVRIRVVSDGTVLATADGIEIKNAGKVTLLVAMATSYVNYADVSGNPVAVVRKHSEAAARKTYSALKSVHVAAHQALFRRFSLRLGPVGSNAIAPRPTVQRVATAETAPDPALAALYVQYGRYLLMASSRPGSQPANLQGVWNEGVNPPWGSKFTININTQMNYWPADQANLGECVEPLVRMVEDLAVTGAATARQGYRARGWVTHHNTDLWRAGAPVDGARYGAWPTGGAWLCMSLWDHYEYRPERAYLARIYPLLKGASEFFIDTLVDDVGGTLVTSPSMSPENAHHGDVAICAGPAMDRQILRDLFAATLRACTLLGEPDSAFIATLRGTRARLPPDRIGAQGQLQEWLDDWDAGAPEQKHRHVSHLYAVYPSEQINVRDTPQLVAAAKISLNARGDKSTGWATAWRLCLWARMGEGERAHAILLGLLGPDRTYPNMFDAHPPFQIDGNFGGAAGILEMLVQSWGAEIRLLPALPKAWPDGALRGLRARGGIELDIEWQAGRITLARLRGLAGQIVRVREGSRLSTLTMNRKGQARYR